MLDQFKNYLLLQGSSDKTASDYVGYINMLLKNLPYEQWTQDTINTYLLNVKQSRSVSCVNGYIKSLKHYFAFMKREDIKLPSLFQGISKLPTSFTEEYFETEVLRVIRLCCKDHIKITAVAYFMFYTGIRIGEIEHTKRKDFDLIKKTVKITCPKTKEERMVYITNKAREAISYYFDSEAEETNAFNISSDALSSLFVRLKPYFEDINFHPHLFRHSFCVNCLVKGVDLYTVSKLMGHRNIATTTRYLGLTNQQMQNIYEEKVNKRKRKR